MSKRFIIEGGHPLEGVYRVQGNKNAALPLIAASFLVERPVEFSAVPQIVDVQNMLLLVEKLGFGVSQVGRQVSIRPAPLKGACLPAEIVEKLRGSILLLGALAGRVDSLFSPLPGGCPIGLRSFRMHWEVFRSAGFLVQENSEGVQLKREKRVSNPEVYLEESSVTATENALLLYASLGSGSIYNPAREPHVLALVDFLRQLGCEIELHPNYFRIRSGVSRDGDPVQFSIPGDYIDAGTVAIATAVTRGRVELTGVSSAEILGFRSTLERFGIEMRETGAGHWVVQARGRLKSPSRVVAGLWPSFPTDLVSLAIVLATNSQGLCLIHDWMYESRMFFVDKLVRMGASATLCDPHRVLVQGPSRLKGIRLESPDIRAGMALVVAGLCSEGTTTIEMAEIIERGYENVISRLNDLGARVKDNRNS